MLYLHLFSLRHVEFVRGLAGKVDTIKEPDADKSSKITYKLMSMLLRYYIRVVASLDNEFAPQSIEFTSSMLQKLACRGKDFAKWMLEAIISRTSEEGKSRSIALHYKRTVRLATNRLIMACFRHLREHDAKYVRVEDEDSVMVPTIQGLTRLQSLLLERAPSVWWEYFELLRHVAELGSEETHVLLHLGVLQWCFEVLFIKEDTVLQKKHPDIMRYLAQDSRSLNYPAIINCIYGLLHNFVDLSGPTAFDSSERQTGARMLLLTDEEYDYLLQQSRSGINWIVEHCMQGFERLKKMDWHEWPPSKLIVLLTNANRVSHKLYKDTVQTLIINIESTTDWDVISQSVALCLLERKMKSTTEEDVFQEIRRILNSYEARRLRHPEAANLLWIVTNVYGTHSPMLLPHMAAMTLSFLVCDDSEVEKDTRDWLRNSVLQQGVLSKPYTVDQVQGLRQKICSIRELLIGLGDQLIGPIYKNEASSLYEYSIDAYQDCGTYLSQVSSRLKPELEEWLKNEESDTEALTEFDTTVQELIDDTSKIHELLRNHGELRDRIREWQDERSSSDGPSNSHIYEIDDGEFWLLI
jgi:hypothetical protein